MFSFLLNREIKEESLVPCYFFYGEECFIASQFISKLREALISPDKQDYNLERFNLEDHSWAEIIDLARTIPFFFSSWRIIVVEIPKDKGINLSAADKKTINDYLSSPSSQTIIVVIFQGKIKKNSSFFTFFSSFGSSSVYMKELKSLKEKPLLTWIEKKILSFGKTATFEARKRIAELVGNDLRRVNNEINKLITFVGEKKVIELDDVNQISGHVKTFFEWEIADSLEKADIEQGLIVLSNLLRKEAVKPEYILGSIARFFRDIFLAKLWLREKDADKKVIFRELKPHISEKFGGFYRTKFMEFFSLVEKFSMKDLNRLLSELERIDFKMKTSALPPQTLIESFLFEYCDVRRKDKVTWRGMR